MVRRLMFGRDIAGNAAVFLASYSALSLGYDIIVLIQISISTDIHRSQERFDTTMNIRSIFATQRKFVFR
jgi:succinylarginine dihydrolase